MPFDPDAYLKSKQQATFNPDAYLASRAPKQAPQSQGSPLEASIQGFAKGIPVIGSYLPQMQAAVAKSINAITPESSIDKSLRKQGFNVQPGEQSYAAIKDQMSARDQKLAQENPLAYGTGVAGGLITSGAMLSKLPMAQSSIGRLAQASGTGALVGGLSSPDMDDSVSQRLQNAKTGAVVGLLGQGAGETLGKIGSGLANQQSLTGFKKVLEGLEKKGEHAMSAGAAIGFLSSNGSLEDRIDHAIKGMALGVAAKGLLKYGLPAATTATQKLGGAISGAGLAPSAIGAGAERLTQ